MASREGGVGTPQPTLMLGRTFASLPDDPGSAVCGDVRDCENRAVWAVSRRTGLFIVSYVPLAAMFAVLHWPSGWSASELIQLALMTTAISVGMLFFYRKSLVPIEETSAGGHAPVSAPVSTRATAATPTAATAAPFATSIPGPRRLVLAVGGSKVPVIAAVTAPLARAQQAEVYVLAVAERDVLAGEDAIDLESEGAARAELDDAVTQLHAAGVDASGELLHVTGSHADVASRILTRTAQLGAATIVLGPETQRHRANQIVGETAARATGHVIVLHPEAGPLGSTPVSPALMGSRAT